MKITYRSNAIGFVALLLTACGGAGDAPESYVVAEDAAGDSAAKAAESAASTPAAAQESEAASGPTLTPEYLEGTWCFAYTDLGKGNREEQSIEYVFNTDGTLTYQRNPTGGEMDPGSYEVQGDMVDLRPMFMVFDLRIDSVEDDEFVLKGMGRHFFIRGVCPE
ncbi:hypothetical protein [Lentisalinibacter sediminis]|uniref:hypothetical protein n=1 Tax=Lentisalinibacter sediminis TaxID=2992237 RepID=UPI0038681BD9